MPRRQLNIPRLFAAAALGLATTIAVAWALACSDIGVRDIASAQQILPERGAVTTEEMGGPANGVAVDLFEGRGHLCVDTRCYGPTFVPFPGIPLDLATPVQIPPDAIVPESVRGLAMPWLRGYPWPRGAATDWRQIQASGWPMLALASERRLAPNFTHEQRFGIAIPGKRGLGDQTWGRAEDRVLPLFPLWSGLFADTLLFAAAWWELLLVPGALRAAARRRRGLCPRCGYDLRATPVSEPCPECGRSG